jgi:hypothetical protein
MKGSPPEQPEAMTSVPATELFAAFATLEKPTLKLRIKQAMAQGKSEASAVAELLAEKSAALEEGIRKDGEEKPGFVTERTARLFWVVLWLKEEIQRLDADKPALTVVKGGR